MIQLRRLKITFYGSSKQLPSPPSTTILLTVGLLFDMTLPSPRRISLPAEEPQFVVLAIQAPTGVIYEQQCGGFYCDQLEVEGYLTVVVRQEPDDARPDRFGVSPADLTAIFHSEDDACHFPQPWLLTPERIDRLDALIRTLGYFGGPDGPPVQEFELDRSRLDEVFEAWVPVITPDGPGVLLWNNCD